MRALCWCGKKKVRVENVPEPRILNDQDAIVRVSLTAICGSDLHLYDGYIPTMHKGDILGHEFMGEVVEVGRQVTKLKPGDRVVVPFTISCGRCFYCKRGLYSACDNSNPNAHMGEALYGHGTAGIYGYSHLTGGFAGGQAEYARVPFADPGPIKVPDALTDEQVLFLSDIFPTGFQAAENGNILPGDTVAVWGCGPVGQMTIRSAFLLKAGRVIAIDRVPSRLQMAADAGADTINMNDEYVYERVMDLSGGRGPDVCIDCVGLEAMGHSIDAAIDRVKAALYMATDRGHALRQAIHCCRKAGTLSIPGVYGGFMDMFPIGALMEKGLTVRAGQTHMQRYLQPLLEKIEGGDIDPSFVITHRLNLDEAAEGYDMFAHDQDECIKVVMKP